MCGRMEQKQADGVILSVYPLFQRCYFYRIHTEQKPKQTLA